MTNEQLKEYLDDAIAQAIASASSAQASGGAGTAGARTQSNKEADSGTEVSTKDIQTDSDIGIEEAWSANVKRTYDVHQSYDNETLVQNRTHFNTMITQQQNHLAALNQMSLQAVANNQNQSNLNNLIGIDRTWNVNETDGFAVLLSKVVGDAVKGEFEAQEAK